jgi:hypothetical protein
MVVVREKGIPAFTLANLGHVYTVDLVTWRWQVFLEKQFGD